jgi:hypothetical protein
MQVKSRDAFHFQLRKKIDRSSLSRGIFLAQALVYLCQMSKIVFKSVKSPPTALKSRYTELSPESDYSLSRSVSLIEQSTIRKWKPKETIPFQYSCP